MRVSFFTGAEVNGHYELGLLSGLSSTPLSIEVIGSNIIMHSDILKNKNILFLNYFGDRRPDAAFKDKLLRIMKYYYRIIRYAIKTDSDLFHIQSINKFVIFDRTILMMCYKILGKKIVFTAHNIDREQRDEKSTFGNAVSLKYLYKIVDHIIVHTDKMRLQLMNGFGVPPEKISVIPHGIMNVVPKTEMSTEEARKMLNLRKQDKVILFFGKIAPYKGLEYLILALAKLACKDENIRIIIAGNITNCEEYWKDVENLIRENGLLRNIINRIEYIRDEDVEIYFKASDVLALPYKHIFQSGVIFLSYHFGLPVIAADVGSLHENIIEGETGFLCRSEDPDDLANTITKYFESDLYRNLETNRLRIIRESNERYSWEEIGKQTYSLYKGLAARAG